MGLYYSLIEWETNRTGRTPSGRYIPQEAMDRYGIPLDRYVDDHVIPQLQELVTRYEPVVIFSDAGEWDQDEELWKTKEFLAWLYNNAPNKDEVVVTPPVMSPGSLGSAWICPQLRAMHQGQAPSLARP